MGIVFALLLGVQARAAVLTRPGGSLPTTVAPAVPGLAPIAPVALAPSLIPAMVSPALPAVPAGSTPLESLSAVAQGLEKASRGEKSADSPESVSRQAFDGDQVLSPGAPPSLLSDEANTVAVVEAVAPSVVSVTRLSVGRDAFNVLHGRPDGSGSGFVWDRQGHIVTNAHVTRGGNAFVVTLHDGTALEARRVGSEPRKDIAVLEVAGPTDKLVPLPVGDSDALRVGQKAVAVGNPYGLGHSVSKGIVSAKGRELLGAGGVTIREMIQTDATINPGNSGGPLLDSGGRLIGMNTMMLSPNGSQTGIGFAVPSNTIKRIVPEIIRYGRAVQIGMGIGVLLDAQKHALLGLMPGVVIREVPPGSPAAAAGLRGLALGPEGEAILGDIIVGIDEHVVRNYDELYNALDRYKAGDLVTVGVIRDGTLRHFRVELVSL